MEDLGLPTIANAKSGQPSAEQKKQGVVLIKSDESNPNTIYNLIVKENNQNGN